MLLSYSSKTLRRLLNVLLENEFLVQDIIKLAKFGGLRSVVDVSHGLAKIHYLEVPVGLKRPKSDSYLSSKPIKSEKINSFQFNKIEDQLIDAFTKNKLSAQDVIKLGQFSDLKGIKAVIDGKAEIRYPDHFIDLAAAPFIPRFFGLKIHFAGDGLWKWNPKIPLHLFSRCSGKIISGYDLQKEVSDKPVLSANVLDYLLAHQEIIPEEWRSKIILFMGTTYFDFDGNPCVRCLFYSDSKWSWHYFGLENNLIYTCYVALMD